MAEVEAALALATAIDPGSPLARGAKVQTLHVGNVLGRDVRADLLADLPPELPRWSPLAQDQYLEIRTLLSGYILSSQGDRMLMAHSVEGRFPFLDVNVVALGRSLRATSGRHEAIKRGLLALYEARSTRHGCRFAPGQLAQLLDIDTELNAQGMGIWLDRDAA